MRWCWAKAGLRKLGQGSGVSEVGHPRVVEAVGEGVIQGTVSLGVVMLGQWFMGVPVVVRCGGRPIGGGG